MRLRILGTRGNIESSAPRHIKHAGILVDDKLLFDLGEKEYLSLKPKHIFITHLDSDHAVLDLEDVSKGVRIHTPEVSSSVRMVRVAFKPIHVNSYTIVPIPTVHSHRVKSVGYLIQKGVQRIFYSSDMVKIEHRYHRLLENLDLVITEGSFIRSKGLVRVDPESGQPFGHNGIPELVKFFSRFTRFIVITHFGTWFFKDVAESQRKLESLGNGVRIIAAYDGMKLDVKRLVCKAA